MKCRICHETIVSEDEAVCGLNPESFRQALMHQWCLMMAYQALEEVGAKQPTKFSTRQDEYDQLEAAHD